MVAATGQALAASGHFAMATEWTKRHQSDTKLDKPATRLHLRLPAFLGSPGSAGLAVREGNEEAPLSGPGCRWIWRIEP